LQEVSKLAIAARKDLAEREKEEVSLTERKKHSKTQVKKLTKSLEDVGLFVALLCGRG
jgi:structural maintenance of chromosome 4